MNGPSQPQVVDRRQGFTLLEVIIAGTILSIALGSLTTIMLASSRSLSDQVQVSRARAAGQRALGRLAELALTVEPTSILPMALDDSREISFEQVTGFDGTANTTSPRVTVRLEPMTGEEQNGLDDNGDGRVDESFLVLAEGADTIVLAPDVLDLRINSTLTGFRVAVDVGVAAHDGTVRERTLERQWSFRNQ